MYILHDIKYHCILIYCIGLGGQNCTKGPFGLTLGHPARNHTKCIKPLLVGAKTYQNKIELPPGNATINVGVVARVARTNDPKIAPTRNPLNIH